MSITLKQFEKSMVNMYIDYVNNFGTLAGFASYHGLSLKGAQTVIDEGRKLNEMLAQAKGK